MCANLAFAVGSIVAWTGCLCSSAQHALAEHWMYHGPRDTELGPHSGHAVVLNSWDPPREYKAVSTSGVRVRSASHIDVLKCIVQP